MGFFKLLTIFTVVFSLVALQSPPANLSIFPTTPTVRAASCTGLGPEPSWYPAGPFMDSLLYKIYPDESSEFAGLQNGEFDLTDWPLSSALYATLYPNPSFCETSPISDTGYFELEFHEAANFWGCSLDFGNSVCGRNIRQAFAHSLDKAKFTSLQPDIAGVSVPIDNPVPAAVGLTIPNPCSWDALFPQTGANCVVGEGGNAGGVAYHLAPAASCGLNSCASTPTYPWTPGLGTPDFCAAADHFIAAGVASSKNSTTCVLTGISLNVAQNPVNIFIRSDHNPRLQGGESVAQFVCALLTGIYTTGCPAAGLTVTEGPITGFPFHCGLGSTCCTTLCVNWNIYTAGFGNIPTFDASLYYGYDSRFVSGYPSIQQANGGHCSNDSVPTSNPSNYIFLCDPTYDSLVEPAEFAPCFTATGDPVNGQATPTFADCPSTSSLTAKSASYQAQDEFGMNAFTIPWYSGKNSFALRSEWNYAENKGDGLTPPGSWITWLNSRSAAPVLAGTIRQGFKEPPTSANPFAGNTAWDAGLRAAVYERPNEVNPDSPQSTLDWMTTSTRVLANFTGGCTNCISYTAPAGTVETFRYTFRTDIRWQTGQPMTAFDAAFSYVAYMTTGSLLGAGLSSVTGVKVVASNVMDVNVKAVGPFTQLFLSAPVIPGRFWVDPAKCTPAQWDANANAAISATTTTAFGVAWTNMQPCISSSVQTSGAGNSPVGIFLRTGSSVDAANKVVPQYDPMASSSILSHCGTGNVAVPDCGAFVGSGAWACVSPDGIIGTGCSSSGNEHVPPGGTFTLTRYGLGKTPGGSLDAYFRSSGNLALWTWTGNTGVFNTDFFNFATVSICFGKTPVPAGCARWSMGIGDPDGSASAPATVSVIQIGIVARFVGVNWVSPYNWLTAPPQGIAPFPPTLYEGSASLRPASVAGCSSSFRNGGGYDC